MTNPYRALCAELVDDLELCDWPYKLKDTIRADIERARAVLAESDGPAVPEGREPASVATQPTEPEAEGPTDEQLNDIADETPWRGSPRHFGREVARAVLARWGHPAAAPVPEPGEVAELVAWLRSTRAARLTRAAALLSQRHPTPVPVSERLPGPEDCDAEGRCWMFGKIEGDWRLVSTINPGIPKLKYCFSHWLPANALPLPAPEGGEVS